MNNKTLSDGLQAGNEERPYRVSSSVWPFSVFYEKPYLWTNPSIVGLLDLLERVNDPFFLFLVRRKVKSLVAIPVHVMLCPLLIDIVTVPDGPNLSLSELFSAVDEYKEY